jgi:protein-L-isoaspartate O-methyltransferase
MQGKMWRSYAERLLTKLQADGLVGQPELQVAYWTYPRHEFVEKIYAYDADTLTWRHKSASGDSLPDEDWLDEIYRNEALIVNVDTAGTPRVCDARPSLVFRILDRIGVEAGDNVLQVGTGTGQLTGILGELAGASGGVISLEADAELAGDARHRLARFDQKAPTAIVEADALTWQPGEKRFDIVVAMQSCWPVPEGWMANLAPGGRLCAELRGELAGALLLAQRKEGGSGDSPVTGQFADEVAGFLPLHASRGVALGSCEILLDFVFDEVGRTAAAGLGARQFLMHPFTWYCQLELPRTRLFFMASGEGGQLEAYLQSDDGMDAVRLPDDESAVNAELVSFGGRHELMARLAGAWRDWQRYGCPVQEDYLFGVDGDGAQTVSLKGREHPWRL